MIRLELLSLEFSDFWVMAFKGYSLACPLNWVISFNSIKLLHFIVRLSGGGHPLERATSRLVSVSVCLCVCLLLMYLKHSKVSGVDMKFKLRPSQRTIVELHFPTMLFSMAHFNIKAQTWLLLSARYFFCSCICQIVCVGMFAVKLDGS